MTILTGGKTMNEKKIAKANWIAERFGLASNREYVLERSYGGLWSVYDFDGHYITECRTDCFDNYRNIEASNDKMTILGGKSIWQR